MNPMDEAPKYRKIFEQLREEILSGRFAATERFPSEEQLVRRFRVSRNTVRSALEDLKRAGIIETRNGAGTYLSTAMARATGAIGLIVPGFATGEIFPRICTQIMTDARRNGYATLFGDASTGAPDVRTTQVLRLAHDYADRKVDGVILEPPELLPNAERTTRTVLDIFDRNGIPVVLLDRDITDGTRRSGYDLVGINNFDVGYMLARHLVEQGAKSVHMLIRPGSAPTVRQRAQGVREALLDLGLRWGKSSLLEFEPDDEKLVGRAFSRKVDAVVCGNDATAARLIGALGRIGRRVPQDILVAGVDDIRLSTLISPKLTTVRQPCEEIATAAVRTLLDRIRNPRQAAREIRLGGALVVRESSVRLSQAV